jgi:hypothetical protein
MGLDDGEFDRRGVRDIMAPVASPTVPTIPLDAAEFAGRQGVLDYVRPILEMTQRLFPEAHITLALEADAEDREDRYLVINVPLTNLDPAEVSERHWQWAGDLFQHCPAPQAHFFVLGVDLT